MTTKSSLFGKRLPDLLINQDEWDPKLWFWRCGKKRRFTGSGYTNLVSHIKELHSEDNSLPVKKYVLLFLSPFLFIRDFSDILLDRKEDLFLDLLCSNLLELNVICKPLQHDSTTLFDVGAIFGRVAKRYPETAHHFRRDSIIVDNQVFEYAVVKLQESQFHDLCVNWLQSEDIFKYKTNF